MTNPSVAAVQREHQPALDGVRGVSVAMVLLFHGGVSFMTGGYVGVSVFFTLSGFLITGLLLSERAATGGISAPRFYARRVRRLMPASLLCLAAVSVAAWLGEFDGLPHLRRDILSSLFQVANWNALSAGTGYADLMARGLGRLGPVDHFWSLAVEEQFYWLWPLVCMALLSRGAGTRRARVGIVALAVAGVAAAPVIAHVWGANAAYWATPARLGEILVGAAFAAVMHGRRFTWSGLPWLGLAGLAVVVWAAITWPSGSGPAYSGWLGVFALASAALIAGLQPASALRTAFSVPPLVYLGRISYGVYLYHWPVFAIVDERRVGADGWTLFALRIAITLAVAAASFHGLEQRIRHGRSSGRRVAVVTVAAIAVVTVLVVVAVPGAAPTWSGGSDVPATFATSTTVVSSSVAPSSVAPTTTPVGSEPAVTTTTSVPSGPATVLLLGDSTMVALSDGLSLWASQHADQMQVASLASPGCGLLLHASMGFDPGQRMERACTRVYEQNLPELLAAQVPDMVAIMITLPDLVDRTWSAEEGPVAFPDPRYVERLNDTYRDVVTSMIAAGVRHIAWVVPPTPELAPDEMPRWQPYVQVVVDTARQFPDVIELVRLDQWFAAQPDADTLRSDGLHLSPDGAFEVSDRYLAEVLLQIART